MALTKRAKRRLILLTILVVILVGGALVAMYAREHMRSSAAIRDRAAGMALYEEGDYEGALVPLSNAVRRLRTDLELLNAFAETRSRVSAPNRAHLTAAAALYEEALVVDPKSTDALRGLVDVYAQLGYRQELLEMTGRLLAVEPDDLDALEARTRVLRRLARWDTWIDSSGAEQDGAIALADRMRRLDPDDPTWLALQVDIRLESGERTRDVIETVRVWLAESPDDLILRLIESALLVRDRRLDEAIDSALRAAEPETLRADSLGSLLNLLSALAREDATRTDGRTNTRKDDLEAAIERVNERADAQAETDPDIADALVTRAFNAEELPDALARARSAAERFPDDGRFTRAAADVLTLLDRTEEAIAAGDAWLETVRRVGTPIEVIDAQARVAALRARGTFELANWREADAVVLQAIARTPRDPVLHLIRGELAGAVGESELQLQSFRDAFDRSERRWLTAGLRLADALIAARQPREALDVANTLEERYRKLTVLLAYARARIAIERGGARLEGVEGNISVSRMLWNQYDALEADPEIEDASFLLPLIADACAAENDVESLGAALELGLEGVPPDVQLLLARIAVRRGLDDEADELADAAERAGGMTLDLAAYRADRLADSDTDGAREEGLALLRTALAQQEDLDPGDAERTLMRYAITAELDDRWSLAEALLDAAPDDPRSIDMILGIGDVWIERPELAERALARLEELLGTEAPRVVFAGARRVVDLADTTTDTGAPAITKKEVAEELDRLDEILETSPNSLDAMLLSYQLLQSGPDPDPDVATEVLRRAVDTYPGDRRLYPMLINALQRQGEYLLADEYLARFRRLDGGDLGQLRQQVPLLMAQGELEEAVGVLRSIVDAGGTVYDQLTLAETLSRIGRIEEARAEIERIRNEDPGNLFALQLQTDLLAADGDVDGAIAALDRFEGFEDEADRAYLKTALLITFGEPAIALAAAESLVQRHPDDPNNWNLAARMRRATGDEAGAFDALERAIALAPDDPDVIAAAAPLLIADPARRAQGLAALDRVSDARPALAATMRLFVETIGPDGTAAEPTPAQLQESLLLTRRHPLSIPAWQLAWTLHQSADQLDEAARITLEVIDRFPNRVEPVRWRMETLMRQARWIEAADAARLMRVRTRFQPAEADAAIARLEIIAGRPERALEALESYVDADRFNHPTTTTEIRARLIEAFARTGDVAGAYRLLRDHLSENDVARQFFLELAAEIDPANGREAVRLVEADTGDDAGAKLQLARTLSLVGRNAKVEADATGDEALPPGSRAARRAIAEDSFVHALELAAEARALDERMSRPADLVAASVAESSDEPGEADRLYTQVIDSFGPDERALFDRVTSLPDQQRRQVYTLLELYVGALNNRAYLATKVDGDLERANADIDTALGYAPRAADLIDTRAEIRRQRGSLERALDDIDDAIQLSSGRASFRLRRARILADLGRIDEARTAARSLQNDLLDSTQPDLEDVQNVRLFLESLD